MTRTQICTAIPFDITSFIENSWVNLSSWHLTKISTRIKYCIVIKQNKQTWSEKQTSWVIYFGIFKMWTEKIYCYYFYKVYNNSTKLVFLLQSDREKIGSCPTLTWPFLCKIPNLSLQKLMNERHLSFDKWPSQPRLDVYSRMQVLFYFFLWFSFDDITYHNQDKQNNKHLRCFIHIE